MTEFHEVAGLPLGPIFEELEKASASEGLVYRRIYRSATLDVVIHFRADQAMRGMQLEFKNQLSEPVLEDQVKGLRTELKSSAEGQVMLIEQTRLGDQHLFTTVSEDIIRAVSEAAGDEAYAAVQRLAKWRAFFNRALDGLSREQQLGLFGELYALISVVSIGSDKAGAIKAWHGPRSAIHDFSSEHWALEVKSTAVAAGTSAQVSNEHQLDPAQVPPLFLLYLVFDVRPHNAGATLSDMVDRCRRALREEDALPVQFEDLLIDAGFHDVHRALYTSHYLLRREELFEINDDFPSLRASDLPREVSRVTYALNIDLVQPWRARSERLYAAMGRVLNED
jgi:hypothetical protein